MESQNLNVKSAKAQKCKSAVFRQSQTCEIRRLKDYKIKKICKIIAAKFNFVEFWLRLSSFK